MFLAGWTGDRLGPADHITMPKIRRELIGLAFAAVAVFALHLHHAFFLFDDFAFIGEARHNGVASIFGQALFGFYRPLAFVVAKAESSLFGWSSPAGYAFVSMMLHIANALLWGQVLKRAGWGVNAAASASVFFLLSPWAGETVFWVSCQFDLLATLFMLLALLTVERRLVLGFAFAVAAQLTKEGSVIVPVLFAALLVSHSAWSRRKSAALCLLVIACGVGIGLRSQYLPMFGGAYGNYFELLKHTQVLTQLTRFVTACARIPFDPMWGAYGVLAVTHAAIAAFLVLASLRHRRKAVVLSAAYVLCVAPVVWMSLGLRSSDGGRTLYAPSLLVVAVLGLAYEHRAQLVGLAFGIFCLVSLWYQMTVWGAASELSRSVVEQVEPHLGAPALLLTNFPSTFVEGPYILKPYAFAFYFEDRHVPPIRVSEVRMRFKNGLAEVAEPIAADPSTPPESERTVELRLAE